MTTQTTAQRNTFHLAIRWLARLLSLLSIGVIMMFAVGEGTNPFHLDFGQWVMFAFFPTGICLGMMMAWRWEGLGGTLTISSLALFYVIHWIAWDRWPGGPFFAIFTLPGFLFLASWMYGHAKTKS